MEFKEWKSIHEYCMEKPCAYETRPFGKYPICYRIAGKIFAQLSPEEDWYKITLKTNPDAADFYRRAYPGVIVGAKIQRKKYEKYNKRDDIHDVIVVYKGNEAVACGSYKFYDEETVELKRIFTDKSVRGIGVGKELVRRLEADAKIAGYRFAVLETGELLTEACGLYKKLGYREIPNYGQYADMPESLCMRKKL